MWSRAPRPPSSVVAAVGEPALVTTDFDGDRWVVLTRTEVVLVTEDGVAWRHPWHEVERGDWDGGTHTLTVHWVGERAPSALVTREQHPRDMPLVFRERVDASVVHVETEPARGGGTLRAAVRRTAEGDLITQVIGVGRVRPGADLDAQIDALEARVREAVGL